jgi:hypothetical protein
MDFFYAAYLFFVSRRSFELPILLERGFGLRDEDQESLFMNWLGEHGSSLITVARLHPHQQGMG